MSLDLFVIHFSPLLVDRLLLLGNEGALCISEIKPAKSDTSSPASSMSFYGKRIIGIEKSSTKRMHWLRTERKGAKNAKKMWGSGNWYSL